MAVARILAERPAPAPLNCGHCGEPLNAPPVLLNGARLHTDCFGPALRRLEFDVTRVDVDCTGLDPMVAYHLGKQHVAVIVASRRKTKKKP